jgi:hypothetical protein
MCYLQTWIRIPISILKADPDPATQINTDTDPKACKKQKQNTGFRSLFGVHSLLVTWPIGTLETQLRVVMDAVDELNQESIKFNKHQNMVLKQYQEKTR